MIASRMIPAIWFRLVVLIGFVAFMIYQGMWIFGVITGLLIVAIGVLFWRTNGLIGVPELIPLDVQAGLQNAANVFTNPIFDILAILVITAVILTVWFRRRSHSDEAGPADETAETNGDRPQFAGTATDTPNLISLGSASPKRSARGTDRQERL